MTSKVKVSFSDYPNLIDSGLIKLNCDQSIKIYPSKENIDDIVIQVIDNSFGGEYINDFVLDFETAKDFYDILYRLLKQIQTIKKGGTNNGSNC